MKTIGSKTIPPKEITHESDRDYSNSKKLGIAAKINKKVTADGVLPDNKVIHRNYLVQEAMKAVPKNPELWHADKMYPLLDGRKLLVDEPIKKWEIEECTKKQTLYKTLGLTYIIVMPNTTMRDALIDAGVEIN